MRIAFTSMVAAVLVLASGDAAASAWATARIGDTSISQTGSGPDFGITFWNVSLDTGESVSQTFDWSVTLHTDGLPASRTWDDGTMFGCMPLHELKCGPEPTGLELIEAFLQTYRDGREANPFIEFSGTFADDLLYDSVGTQTTSGSFTLTATNIGVGPQADGISFVASLWVDSSDASLPVAEPGELALGAAGLSLMLAALRRRTTRSLACVRAPTA